MPFSVRYDPESARIRCSISGTLDMHLIAEFVDELVHLMNQHQCFRILSDLRGIEVAVSTVDIYHLPKLIEQRGYTGPLRRAVVFDGSHDDFEFYENVSVNQGQNLRVFSDFDHALEWLKA